MTQRIAPLPGLALAGLAFLACAGDGFAAGPKVANIINFIRGTEPRASTDLLEPVKQQIQLAKTHHLPSTFLLQYDALINPDFVNLLKSQLGPNDEIGVWLEVVQPQVESAGLVWKGRWVWDYNTAVGLTEAYTVEERQKLMDVLMERFKTEFGYYPKSVGCWVLDAPTLNYLYDKYHIVAACNCKDQSGTDGYTLWGGYWNQAYYPSRQNAFMPAQTTDQQLNVPVFRMLGSDPVYQYDNGLGNALQGVISLEPVYQPGGGSPDWVRWFFNANFNAPNLAFAYTQAGQENSFGWPAMANGLTDQYTLMEQMVSQGSLQVQTLGQSGTWYRSTFDKTPATSVVAMSDFDNQGHKSVWYESRYYRVNLYWEGNAWRVRDLHVFNEKYPERYLKDRVTGSTCTYDTLPVMDGHHWSTPTDLAGIRPLVNTQSGTRQLLANGAPTVTEVGTDSLLVTMPVTIGGEMRIHCNPTNFSVEMTGTGAPSDWGLEMGWNAQQPNSIVNFSQRSVGYQHNNFGYALRTNDATIATGLKASSYLMRPDAKTVTFDFDPANSTSYWDINGATPGAGGLAPAGTWNATNTNWSSSAAGTASTVAWQGEGHTAVFAAGTDASGTYTVNLSGTQTADGVVAAAGNVRLNGGALKLTTPAMVRAESGASLTLGTQLTGTAGLLLQGDGSIRLSGDQPLSGPMGITVPTVTMDSGTRFSALTNLTLGSGVSLAANGVTLGVSGDLSLTGASFSGSGATALTGRNAMVTAGSDVSNFALSGTATTTLTAVSPAQATFELDGGSVSLSGSASLTTDRWINRGSGMDHQLTIADNARLTVTDDLIFGDNGSAPITINQTGGMVTNTGATNNPGGDDASNRWGLWGNGADVNYNISGGSLNLTGAPLYLSWDSSAGLYISGTAVVNLFGVEMGFNNRSQSATIQVDGGRLNIGSAGITSGSQTGKTVAMSGGILGATANWSSAVPVMITGDATIDTSGGDITLAGALSGTGTLAKNGSGTLSLTGSNLLFGPVIVNAGTLRAGGVAAAEFDLATGAKFVPGSSGATLGSLKLANGSESTFKVGSTANAITITDANGLQTTGTHVVNVTAAAGIKPGTYPLFRYNGSIGGNGAAAFSLGTATGITATLVNHPATSSVDLVITAADDPGGSAGPFIQELFDGIAGPPPGSDGSLNGKGDTATSLGMTGTWATNTSTGIFTASNFNSGDGLPGLPSSNGVKGGIWNNTSSYDATIYATRPLATPISFAQSRTLYFSFIANNSGDTAMGIGFASGPNGSAEFVGAGLSWNNARAIATGANDSGNAAYIGYGTLDANNGPYGIRAHEPSGSINGPALIVGRLTLNASGPDQIDIKRYGLGSTIDSNPSQVSWSASDSVDSSMNATHLLLWMNGVSGSAAGEIDAIRVGSTWEDVTGESSGTSDPYISWISGASYHLSGADALPNADPDHDGIPNAVEFILGTDPTVAGDRDKLPSSAVIGANLEFTFHRSDLSNSPPEPKVEYSSNLIDWTAAVDGVNGISSATTANFYGTGIAKVVVKVPLSLGGARGLFARLNSNR